MFIGNITEDPTILHGFQKVRIIVEQGQHENYNVPPVRNFLLRINKHMHMQFNEKIISKTYVWGLNCTQID